MSVSKQQSAFSTGQKNPKLFPCIICKKPTDQTCSLCRKVFYCSAQHQQIDWHMKHKTECQGKILQYMNRSQSQSQGEMHGQINNNMMNMSKGLSSNKNVSVEIQQRSVQVRIQNESREWMGVFEQRLIMRRKCLDSYQKLLQTKKAQQSLNNQSQTITSLQQGLQRLVSLSVGLMKTFKLGFIPILQQSFGMTTNKFILQLDYLLDMVLLNKFLSLINKHQQVRKFLLNIDQHLPLYDGDNRFRQVYENSLKGILQLSERYCNDKVSEKVMSRYVLIVERFEGILQKVYVYMNVGLWYMKKTYYHKAINSFTYSLELIQTHYLHKNSNTMNRSMNQFQDNKQTTDTSILLIKSNLLFNLSLCEYQTNQQQSAYTNMQQSYRLRIKSLGKNAIESSHCLYTLSLWTFSSKQWQQTLQYGKQCYRIRKLNKDNYPLQLGEIEKLLQQIYQQLKTQRQRDINQMNTQNNKYYQSLINTNPNQYNNSNNNLSNNNNNQQVQKQPYLQPQQSFIKQLHSSTKPQLMQFKLIITPEMAETYTSKQWEKLTQLLEIDQLITKDQMRRIIFQSQFTESLNQAQRDAFVKTNIIQ